MFDKIINYSLEVQFEVKFIQKDIIVYCCILVMYTIIF